MGGWVVFNDNNLFIKLQGNKDRKKEKKRDRGIDKTSPLFSPPEWQIPSINQIKSVSPLPQPPSPPQGLECQSLKNNASIYPSIDILLSSSRTIITTYYTRQYVRDDKTMGTDSTVTRMTLLVTYLPVHRSETKRIIENPTILTKSTDEDAISFPISKTKLKKYIDAHTHRLLYCTVRLL